MDVEKIIREYITKTIHMSLATSKDNAPWVCEVHFIHDDELNLYWRSEKSRRHSQEIATNPKVAGNIVKQHSQEEIPHGIYFEGTAELLDDVDEMRKLMPLFEAQQGLDERILESAKSENGTKLYRVTVKNWYAFGKFDGDIVTKYELKWN